MPAVGAEVGTPGETNPGVPKLGSIVQTDAEVVTQYPFKQVNPPAVDVPIHAPPTVGVIQVAPSQ